MSNKCCGQNGENIEANTSDTCTCSNSTPGPDLVWSGHNLVVPCGPQSDRRHRPYYQDVPVCPEDNKREVIIKKVSAVYKNSNAFCMPTCGDSIKVVFDNVVDMPIGAYLWAYGIGLLKIIGFNPIASEIELENECEGSCYSQAAPGTPIPSCTIFVVTVPTCGTSSAATDTSYPYLHSGFVAPASGNCLDIAVTTVNGLAVGKNISLSTGTYRVSAIKTATLITICNDGLGLPAGTVVDYQDSNANLIVPITVVDTNPCTNPTVLTGKVIVCKNNVVSPLLGTATGQVPVYDAVTGEAQFRTVGVPFLDCTELTAALTLDPALPPTTTYVANVVSTSAYAVNDIVEIQSVPFLITQIIGLTQMRLLPSASPTGIVTFPANTQLCSADCCSTLGSNIYANRYPGGGDWLHAGADTHSWTDPAGNTHTLTPGGTHTLDGVVYNGTWVNSGAYPMKVSVSVRTWAYMCLTGTAADQHAYIDVITKFGTAVAPAAATAVQVTDSPRTHVLAASTAGYSHCASQDTLGLLTFTVAPGTSLNYQAQSSLSLDAASTISGLLISDANFVTTVHWMAVAVNP